MPDIPAVGRFPGVKESELSAEQKEALGLIAEGRGAIPTPYRFLIVNPVVARALGTMSIILRTEGHLTPREREILIVVTAHYYKNAFIQTGHYRMGMEEGVPKAVMDAIINDQVPDLPDPRERAVYELTLALLNEAPLSQDKAERAEKALGLKSVAEVIAYMGNYAANVYALRYVAMQPAVKG